MSEVAPLILELLTYIEQVEKLKYKPAFTVPTEFFAVYQHELKGLPELQFNIQVDGSDVWLRIPRLHEIAPPQPDEKLGRWITLPKTPAKTPELKTQIEIHEDKQLKSRELLQDHPEITELFHAYIENQWQPWAAAEAPRRKTIKRYNDLFSLQQTISTEGAETQIELVWGLGYAVWKKEGFATVLKHPLISQSCEVTLNERNFDLEVRPRDIEPRIELDTYAEMEIPGVRQLDAFWKGALENGANRTNPFEASTYEGVLKAAVGHLDQGGAYEVLTDDLTPPPPGDKLKITNGWVLYARKRTGGLFLEDVKRLKKAVETAKTLPAVVRSFVEHGGMLIQEQVLKIFRGLSQVTAQERLSSSTSRCPTTTSRFRLSRSLSTAMALLCKDRQARVKPIQSPTLFAIISLKVNESSSPQEANRRSTKSSANCRNVSDRSASGCFQMRATA